MLPQVPANKRSAHGYHLASRHHVSYHPYYSSSPMNSSSHSNIKRIEKNESEELDYLDISANNNNSSNTNSTNNTPNKFNMYYNRSNLSVNNGSDLDVDLSSLSARTPNSRPPTTPVSSSNCNNSLNLDDQSNSASPSLSSKQPNPISCKNSYPNLLASHVVSDKNVNVIFVTPATNSCLSASSSVDQCMNKLDQAELIDQFKTESSSSSASVYSSAVATYSRSSSMNSLNSFDVKSTHSSIPSCSEYSATGTNPSKNMQNNEDMYSTKYQGCVTPTAYSELPSSPGELFPCNNTGENQKVFVNEGTNFYFMTNASANSVNNSVLRNNNRPISMNEISVCTVDSNPSKSNDITVIERTVIANNTHSHNNTHLSAGFGAGSMGNTFIEHIDNGTPENNINDEEDNVIQYDMEGSLWEAASVPRSNVSGLTFPSEPTADLAFIRNLLNRKSTPMSVNKEKTSLKQQQDERLFENEKTENQLNPDTSVLEKISNTSLNNNGQNSKYQWSNYSLTKQFTPPIKLKEHVEAAKLTSRTNKKLFDDEEEFETRSLASLPSDIAYDQSQTINFFSNRSQFGALFNRLESAGGLNNSPASFRDNLREARYLKNFSIHHQRNIGDDGFNSATNGRLDIEDEKVGRSVEYDSYYQQHQHESDDAGVNSDEEFLNEFINEMLPKSALNENKEEEEDLNSDDNKEEDYEEDTVGNRHVDKNKEENEKETEEEEEVVNDEDFDHQQQMHKYLAERNMYKNESDHVLTRILPKIDEVDNENDDSRLVEEESKPKVKYQASHSDKISPYHATPAPKITPVNVVMTKTALLREKQNKALKSKQMKKREIMLSKPPVLDFKNNENICSYLKTKTATISVGYDKPTKSSTVKTKSNQGIHSISIKQNTLKNSKSFNSS